MSITITVTSDFICPWCLIGERRLARALKTLPDEVSVEIRWQPFELNPTLPAEGMDRRVYRSLKFGNWERSQALDAQTVKAAKGDDVAFDYPAMTRTPNTFQAHRLMRLAEHRGLATRLAHSIFSAYFEQGRDIGNIETLTEIAAENGLDRAEVSALFASNEDVSDVRAAEQAQQAAGVRSVPTFDIDGEMISGAQSAANFEAALRRAVDRSEACTSGACAIA